MSVIFKNNATSLVESPLLAAATSLAIRTADADRFPVLAEGDWFPLTLTDSLGNLEIVRVTARSGSTFTVLRGQEGTPASNFPSGARAELRFTAGSLQSWFDVLTGYVDELIDNPPTNWIDTAQLKSGAVSGAMPSSIKTAAYTVVSADTLKSFALMGDALYTVTFGSPASYRPDHQCRFSNLDANRAKFIDLNGVKHRLDPGLSARVFRNGNTWAIDLPGERILTGNITVFVAPFGSVLGSNTDNDGLHATSPFADLQTAVNYVRAINHNYKSVAIKLLAGTHKSGAVCVGALSKQVVFTIVGDEDAPESVILSLAEATTGIYAKDYCAVTLRAVKIQADVDAEFVLGINAGQTGIIDYGNVIGGAMPGGNHIQITDGGFINLVGPEFINGGANTHVSVQSGAEYNMAGAGADPLITANVTWGLAFANVDSGGILKVPAPRKIAIAAGVSATGARWRMDPQAITDLTARTMETVFEKAGSVAGATALNVGIKQSDPDFSYLSTKIIGFTRNMSAASGTQAITGVGFKPKAAIFIGAPADGTLPGIIGIAERGGTRGAMSTFTAAGMYAQGSAIVMVEGSGLLQSGVVSFDDDGCTITWTRFGSTASKDVQIYAFFMR